MPTKRLIMPELATAVGEPRAARKVTAAARTRSNLGERVKDLRLRKRLSLHELATMAGLSRSTLYKVENSGMSLTYEKLIGLSEGLGVEISQLFRSSAESPAEDAFSGRREVGRAGEGDLITTGNYDHFYLCNEIMQKGLVPMFGRVKSRTLEDFGALSTHAGEEFTYVLEGTIEVHTKLYRSVILDKGDYIYLDSTMPHAYLSKSAEDAFILTVCTRPEHPIPQALASVPGAAPPLARTRRRRDRAK
jgi:transcriptional regulator with XRE-family HTH domain